MELITVRPTEKSGQNAIFNETSKRCGLIRCITLKRESGLLSKRHFNTLGLLSKSRYLIHRLIFLKHEIY